MRARTYYVVEKTKRHTEHIPSIYEDKVTEPEERVTEQAEIPTSFAKEEYIRKNGHHFTDSLARFVVDKFVSVNPKIPFNKTEELLKHSDEPIMEDITLGDLHVIINEIRATHSMNSVKSDAHALILAIESLNNPNKDSEELFDDWIDILERRKEDICWENYI